MSKLMGDFLSEAKHLLEIELVAPISLPTIQGLCYIYTAHTVLGQDRLGYAYLIQAAELVNDVSESDFPQSMSPAELAELSHAINVTCWGVWNELHGTCLTFMRPSVSPLPQRPIPRPYDIHPAADWWPYPLQRPCTPSYTNELLEVRCELAPIEHAIVETLWGNSVNMESQKADREDRLFGLHSQYTRQLDMLPSHLKPHADAPAAVFCHQ